jgi:tetratricopeptide (TPR) repeat protein
MSPAAIDNNNLGWAYYNAGYTQTAAKNDAAAKTNYEQSKVFLQKAVEQDPKLDAAYVNLGATHNGLGEYQQAVTVLNTANQLHPNWTVALGQLGIGYRGLKDLANAINVFKQVINLDSNSVSGLFNLGEAYNASGNKKEAKKINDRLKKLNPQLAATLNDIFNGKIPTVAVPSVKVPSIPKPRLPKFP